MTAKKYVLAKLLWEKYARDWSGEPKYMELTWEEENDKASWIEDAEEILAVCGAVKELKSKEVIE